MRKNIYLVLCLALFMCACGSVTDNTISTVSDTPPSASVNEEKEVTTIIEEEETLPVFASWADLTDFLLNGAADKLIADGVISDANSVFYDYYLDYAPGMKDIFNEGGAESRSGSFFCYSDSGEIKFLKYTYTAELVDDSLYVYSCDYYNMEENIELIKSGNAEKWDDSYYLLHGYGTYCLSTTFEELISYQDSTRARKLEDIMKDNGLTKDMPLMSLLYKKGDINDYASPVLAVKKLIPELDAECEELFWPSMDECMVKATLENGTEMIVGTLELGKTPDGAPLYGLFSGGVYREEFAEEKEKLYNAKIADLEEARSFTYDDVYAGASDFDYFFVKDIEGQDAELFALENYEGYLLRVEDKIYPINQFVADFAPKNLIAADFDKDGTTEYGFQVCDGRGTGFWTEALIIVDPDEKNPVKKFNSNDLKIYNGNIFSKIKSEVATDNNSIMYWLEQEDDGFYGGNIDLSETVSEDKKPTRLYAGDLISIDYIEEKWVLEASIGIIWNFKYEDGLWYESIPFYDEPLFLRGDIAYENGRLTYNNIRLSTDYLH